MATATRTVVTTEVITLTLTQAEAEVLRHVTENISGSPFGDTPRAKTDAIAKALTALCIPYNDDLSTGVISFN